MKLYSNVHHVFKGQGNVLLASSHRALPKTARGCSSVISLLERGLDHVAEEWDPSFGGLRIEHTVRCRMVDLLLPEYLNRVLQFLSVDGTNQYLKVRFREATSQLVPHFTVRAIPRSVYLFQGTHFLNLLKACLTSRPNAKLHPLQQFMFAWSVHCCGIVTSRWLKTTWVLMRHHPRVWQYINGARDMLLLPKTSFSECAAGLAAGRVQGCAESTSRGRLIPLAGLCRDEYDSLPHSSTSGTAHDDSDGILADGGLQPGFRVRTNLFRNGMAKLPIPGTPASVILEVVDVTEHLCDASMQERFLDFQSSVLWAVQRGKSDTVYESAFRDHDLRMLRSPA